MLKSIRTIGLQSKLFSGVSPPVRAASSTGTILSASHPHQHNSHRKISLKPNLEKLKLIPSPPGGVIGKLNEPLPKPAMNFFEGSFHWDYERIVAVTLLPTVMVPLYGALSNSAVVHPIVDALLGSLLLIHCHFGFKSCIIDYIPKRVYGFWHKFASGLLQLGSAMGLYGLYELETSNNGLCDLIARLWKDPEAGLNVFNR